MVSVSIEVTGEKPVMARIVRTTGRVSDLRPAWRTIGDYLRDVFGRQFDSEGAEGGSGWAPLKPATVARKSASGMDPKILQATRDMVSSFTSESDGNHVQRMTASSLFEGSRDPKARYHQDGAPRANIPQRQIAELTLRHRRQVTKRIQAFIFDRPASGLGDI